MTTTTRYPATVDRIDRAQELATVLIEDAGTVVDQRVLPVEQLPADGREEGMMLWLWLDDETIKRIEARPEATADRKQQRRERFESLAERPPEEESPSEDS